MGMYDSIMMKVKCPYCGEEKERDVQTKDEDCLLKVFNVGDRVDSQYDNHLNFIAECNSKQCWDKEKNGGYGIGKFYYGKAFLKDGVITGEYEITASDDQRSEP